MIQAYRFHFTSLPTFSCALLGRLVPSTHELPPTTLQHDPSPPPTATLPLTSRTCRCRRILDPLGAHPAACAQSGIFRSHGRSLERASARISKEAGTRATKAFEKIDWNALWTALGQHRTSEHLIWILRCVYSWQTGVAREHDADRCGLNIRL